MIRLLETSSNLRHPQTSRRGRRRQDGGGRGSGSVSV